MSDDFIYDESIEQEFGGHGVELAPVAMTRAELIHVLRTNDEFLIQYFLGEELTVPVPDIHIEMLDLMTHTEVSKLALAIPRGHAKTTMAKIAVVKHYLFTDTRFIVYLSNTHGVAAEACKDIINFLESPNGEQLIGVIKWYVRREEKGFYKFDIMMPGRVHPDGSPVYKRCILRALGAGQQVRGINVDNERPQLAVVDDLEDDDNTATPVLRKKLKQWFFGPFYKCLSKKSPKIIFIGNMISSLGLLHLLVEKSQSWYSRRYGCIKDDGTPLWPDIWPMSAIAEDFQEYKASDMIGRWFAEMMNTPMPDTSPLINADEIYYQPEIAPGIADTAFITVDPAISLETWADKTGIAVHANVEGGIWRTGEYIEARMEPETLFIILMRLCQRWKTRVVGIEGAAYQKALKFLFQVYMEQYQFHFELIEIPHKNKSKTERLAAWTSFIRTKQYALSNSDITITEQLLNYDPSKKDNVDDLIDACSMFVPMIEGYMDTIQNQFELDPAQYDIVDELDVCGA